eukprot:10205274-Lingulodinium_polyedra.AAC.1
MPSRAVQTNIFPDQPNRCAFVEMVHSPFVACSNCTAGPNATPQRRPRCQQQDVERNTHHR